ncbi:hypothetical protein BHM03_00024563 [Ensete ventricosum]|nr:hypothetical protein BHM03_00024563 [Ensete ventricosum]
MIEFAEMVSMSMMHDNPITGGGRLGAAPLVLAPAPPPSPAPRVESGSESDVHEIPIEEARGAPEKDRRKSPHKVDKAAIKGKSLADVSEEPPASRRRPKSGRELCSASARVDGQDYHAIRMCNLPERDSDAPLEPDLRSLTHGTPIWQNGEASTTYIRGILIPRLATDLYTLMSEVLMDGAAKAMVLDLKEGGNPDVVVAAEVRASEAQSLAEHLRVELDEANGRRVLVEVDLEMAPAESARLERQLADLRE